MASRWIAEQSVNLSALPSFRAEHFPYAGPYPWLDQPDAEESVDRKLADGQLITSNRPNNAANGQKTATSSLHKLFDDLTLDIVWDGYEEAIRKGRIKLLTEPAADNDPYPGRFLNPHKKVSAFCRILKHPGLLDWLRLLTGREPKALQTIAAHKGSQQGVHSDSIHMTTYPLGYLTAAWIAFEDIHPDCGPLVYYPGSHKLPYLFSKDVDITEADFKREGYAPYHARYESRSRN